MPGDYGAGAFGSGLEMGLNLGIKKKQIAQRMAERKQDVGFKQRELDLSQTKSDADLLAAGVDPDKYRAGQQQAETTAMLPPGVTREDAGMSSEGAQLSTYPASVADRMAKQHESKTRLQGAEATLAEAKARYYDKGGPGHNAKDYTTQYLKDRAGQLTAKKSKVGLDEDEERELAGISVEFNSRTGVKQPPKAPPEPGFFDRMATGIGKIRGAFSGPPSGGGAPQGGGMLKISYQGQVKELPDTPRNRELAKRPGYSVVQ